MKKITYNNKQYVLNDPQYPVEKTVTDTDMNEIKEVVNYNANESENVKDALINITTEPSSNINVQDCSDIEGSIEVEGNSVQETRSGKNKLKLYTYNSSITVNGVTITINEDGTITLNGTSTAQSYVEIVQNFKSGIEASSTKQIELDAIEKYMFSIKKISGSFTSSEFLMALQTTLQGINSVIYINQNQSNKVITNSDGIYRGWIAFSQGSTFSNYTLAPQIEEGETETSYEEYGAMPSPEYPSKIENVGDNINLFNKETAENDKYINSSTGEVKGLTGTSASDYIDIKGLKEIILSGDDIVRTNGGAFYNSSKEYISGFATTEIWNGIDIPETANYVRVTLTTEKLNNIKIEKGNQLTSYSPYNCGNVDITICNKNLLNQNLEIHNGNYDNLGNPVSNSDKRIEDYIFLKKGNYVISANNNNWINLLIYNIKKELLSILNSNANKKVSFTLQNDGYIRFGFYPVVDSLKDIQIEFGTVNTDIVENKQQTITFPLQERQKLMKGDYLADDGIHHVRKQFNLSSLTNVSDWTNKGLNENGTYTYFTRATDLLDYKKYTNLKGFCSHFAFFGTVSGTSAMQKKGIGCAFYYTDYPDQLFYINTTIPTREELIEWLAEQEQAGTPVIVEYELAEEEIEPYTEEQQEAYNELKKVLPYKLVTNIFTALALLKFNYIADTKTYIDNKYNNLAQQLLNL